MSEIMFSHQKRVKKPFFYPTSPQGILFCQIRVSCQTFKMDIQRCFFLTSHFWPFKNHWTCQKSCFLIRRGLKSLFSIQPPPGHLVLPNKSQLSNLQNGHTEMLFFNFPFLTIQKPLDMSEIMFSHQKRVKKPFFYPTSPQGILFCQIRVSCQTFKMDIQRCFFLTSHFWPFKNHWTCQKSCFLIRRGLKSLFSIQPPPRASCFAK